MLLKRNKKYALVRIFKSIDKFVKNRKLQTVFDLELSIILPKN